MPHSSLVLFHDNTKEPVEATLQNKRIWAFLNKDLPDMPAHIEFIFDVIFSVDGDVEKDKLGKDEYLKIHGVQPNENVKKQHEVYTKNNYNKDILKNVKPAVCIIIGINSLLMKLTGDAKTNYNTLIENANIVQTIKFIFIDTIDVFKKIEYDNWYKGVAKNSEGIWLGNGIANQYTLKISRITKELQDDIPNGFGYVVKRGMPTLTKFLTEGSYEGDNYE